MDDRYKAFKKALLIVCDDHAGLESDLESLIKVCRTGDIDRIKRFVELNYPEGEGDDK